MSLINEALKRAEAEKRHKTDAVRPEIAISPVAPPVRPGRSGGLVMLLAGLGLVAVAAGAWSLLYSDAGPKVPASANASTAAIVGRPAPPQPTRRTAGLPVAPLAKLTSKDDQAKAETAEASFVVAKTLDALKYYNPPARPRPAKTAPTSTPAKASPAAKLARASRTSRRAADAAARKTPVAKFTPSAFKLSAVIRGPDGSTAIIDGRFVKVGATVNGAKVVNIGRYAVELEFNGETFTVQM